MGPCNKEVADYNVLHKARSIGSEVWLAIMSGSLPFPVFNAFVPVRKTKKTGRGRSVSFGVPSVFGGSDWGSQ
eukprot:11180735-Lingulodinium_polyedra.AAC.1